MRLISFIEFFFEFVVLLKIEANSYDSAYHIFESLNNRGIPLSQSDLIKNELLKNVLVPEEKNQVIDYWNSMKSVIEDTDIKKGTFVFIEQGGQATQGWIVTAYAAGASTWTQFSAAGEYTAGNGIDITGSAISVKLDTDSGLTKSVNGLKIDTTHVVRKVAILVGDNSATSFAIEHGLNATHVEVAIYDTTTKQQVETDVEVTSEAVVTVRFAVAPSTDQYKVVIHG
jgi:hypothetical protein